MCGVISFDQSEPLVIEASLGVAITTRHLNRLMRGICGPCVYIHT